MSGNQRRLGFCLLSVACLLAGFLLSAAGCSTTPGGGTGLSGPGRGLGLGKDETLRKRVEADKFPTAEQAARQNVLSPAG
ncbi:MAG: hypothetical protein ABSG68_21030 [Thermoguttaceae bacterium]